MSRDPLQAITREAYGYAANNPINLVDPIGQEAAVPAVNGTADAVCGTTWEVPGVDVATCGTAGTVALGSVADSILGNDAWIEELQERLVKAEAEDEDECRNWRRDKKVTNRELEEAGLDAHELKRGQKGTPTYIRIEKVISMKSRSLEGVPGIPLGSTLRASFLKGGTWNLSFPG